MHLLHSRGRHVSFGEMTKRKRTERREQERAAEKLAEARTKLARLEPGGAPDRPIEVTSASVIEVHATSLPCLACEAQGARVDAHDAITHDGRSLRHVRLRCARCGTRRDLYFRIGTALAN